MTHVNQLNAETKHKAEEVVRKMQFQDVSDRLSAMLIAVYRLPLEQRTQLLEQYYKNLETMKTEREKQADVCETCDGNGELLVDGMVDPREPHLRAAVDVEDCPDCNGTGKK